MSAHMGDCSRILLLCFFLVCRMPAKLRTEEKYFGYAQNVEKKRDLIKLF